MVRVKMETDVLHEVNHCYDDFCDQKATLKRPKLTACLIFSDGTLSWEISLNRASLNPTLTYRQAAFS